MADQDIQQLTPLPEQAQEGIQISDNDATCTNADMLTT